MLPAYKGDVDRLIDLLVWIRQLGGCKEHEAVIVADPDTPAGSIMAARDEASKSFKSVVVVTSPDSVTGWPMGPNVLWLTAAKHAQERGSHWLFLEPDAVLLKPGAIDTLDIHFRGHGTRYMGSLVSCDVPGLPARHLAGVAVYPSDAWTELHASVEKWPRIAFDISTAEITVPQTFHSSLFQALWGEKDRPPRFAAQGVPHTEVFGLDYLRPEAVLFHRNKDGSLIRLLRQRMGIQDPAKAIQRTFIQLGRFGDIILLLPALKYLADMDGVPPRLIVSHEYASVLEGVSYVEVVPLPVHWWSGMTYARKFADHHFGGATVLQCYAGEWGINLSQWPNFMTSMWDRTGVPVDMMHTLPLVFDRRQRGREAMIIPKSNGKPYIIVSHKGVSSPFSHGLELIASLKHLQHVAPVIDVSEMIAPRIFDMLGVMDRALGMVTIDSANLHLAYGCERPFVAITLDGWCGSIPRGNCSLEVKYSQFRQRLPEIVSAVESWL